MAVNINSPVEDVDGIAKITIHAIGDTQSIYEDRDTGIQKSVSDLLMRHQELTNRANEIIQNDGINYDTVLSVESIVPGLLTRNMPQGGYDFHLTKTHLAVSMEAISVGKVTLLTSAVVLICGVIYKLVKKIIDFITGNGKNVENTMSRIDESAKKLKELEDSIKAKEDKLRRDLTVADNRVTVAKWVAENKDVQEILFRICRAYHLSTGIQIDPTKPVEAIQAFVGKRSEHKQNAQGNILASKLPAIMFSDDLEGDFKRYFEYYNYLKHNIRSINTQMQELRSNMMYALNGAGKPVKTYDYGAYLTPISALLQKRYSNPVVASKELKEQVTQDWLTPYRGPVTMTHVGNIIRMVQETPLLKNLVAVTGDKILETEIAALMNSTNSDLQNSDSPHQKSIQELRNNPRVTPHDKALRIQLSEAYMVVIKENLNIINVIAEANTIFYGKFISTIKSVESIVNTYNAYYMHYNMLLDKYDEKFK